MILMLNFILSIVFAGLIHELGHYLTDAEDVTHYDISLADAQTVLLEMSTAFAQAHAKKQTLRERTAEAQTQSDLDKISW